jgi:AcrR family transcriptional regulator
MTAIRKAILGSALDLFVSRGIHAATTREIARRAGAAEGSLYRHFASKDALAAHLFSEAAAGLAAALDRAAAAAGPDPAARLRALVRALFEFGRTQRRTLRFIEAAHTAGFPRTSERLPARLPLHAFIETIAAGQKAGIFRRVDPALAAAWIVGLSLRALSFSEMKRTPVARPQVIAETVGAAVLLLEADGAG